MAEWTAEKLDIMSKPLREFDTAYKEIKTARIVPLETMMAKWGEAGYGYIRVYNDSVDLAGGSCPTTRSE